MARDWLPGELVVDDDFMLDDESAQWVSTYLEVWFDVDAKFGLNTKEHDDQWVNLYAEYNPHTGELRMFYVISDSENLWEDHLYMPSEAERAMVIDLIEQKVLEDRGCSCLEWSNRYQCDPDEQ